MNVILRARKKGVSPTKIEIDNVTGIVTDTSSCIHKNCFCYFIYQEGFKVLTYVARVSDYTLVCEA